MTGRSYFPYAIIGSVLCLTLFVPGLVASQSNDTVELYPFSTLCPATPFVNVLPLLPRDFDYPADNGAGAYVIPDLATFIGKNTYGYPTETPLSLAYTAEYVGGWTAIEDDDLPVRFYLMVDEQFVPIGQNNELYFDATMPTRETQTFTFTVPPLSEGMHTILIIAVGDYMDLPDVNGDRVNIEFLSRRLTIIAGNPPLPVSDPRAYTLLPEGVTTDAERQRRQQGLFRSELVPATTEAGKFWNDPERSLPLQPNQTYTFFAQMGSSFYYPDYFSQSFRDDAFRRFAIFLLEDFQPVSIGDSTLAFYGEMDMDDVVTQIPLSRTAPATGRRDLILLRVDEPGLPTCQLITGGGAAGLSARRVVVEVP
jgi:hypothetical protein